MFTFKRLIGSSLFVFVLACTALTQESRTPIQKPGEADAPTLVAPLVTAAVTAERVRFVSPGSVVQLRLEVYSTAAQKLFDTELHGGNVLDWNLQDGAGERLPSGSYACVLTIKNLSGRLSQRIGVVTLSDNKATIEAGAAAQLSAAQQQTIGPLEGNAAVTILRETEAEAITAVTHNGTEGQLTSSTGALTFRTGDLFSGKDVERARITPEGNVGIGTDKPQAKLEVAGDIRSSGSLRLDKGVEFADGTVQTTGLSGRKDEDGKLVPNVAGTGAQNRLSKWTDNAGTLGDSIVVDTGNGLQLTAPANSSVDTNLLSTNSSSSTIGIIASPAPAFLANNGPYFAMRGNSYTALANQRGLFSISTGNVANPVGAEGSIVLLTGPDQVRMFINPVGNVGIGTGTSNPVAKLQVAGNVHATQYDIAGNKVLSIQELRSTFVGVGAGASNFSDFDGGTGTHNSFFGYRSGYSNIQGTANSFFGHEAGLNQLQGSGNSFFGSSAGSTNTLGIQNSFFGYFAGLSNSTEHNNTFIGALSNGVSGITNATALGYRAQVTRSNSLVLGGINGVNGASDTNVGIGTTAPTYKLHVIDSLNVGIRVETSLAGGRVASFAANGDFQIDATNIPGGRFAVMEGGNVGVNTPTPNAKLQVVGGDVAITTQLKGLILRAIDGGNCFRLTVNNGGALGTTLIACP